MLNYIKSLKEQYDQIKNSINEETNNLNVIDLNVKLSKIESKINYCLNLIIENFEDKNQFEFAKVFIPLERLEKAQLDASIYNKSAVYEKIKPSEVRLIELKAIIDDILSKNPNAEDEEFKDSEDYKKIKHSRANIAVLVKHINETKAKEKKYHYFLNFEDKLSLVTNLLDTFKEGKLSQQELIDKANNYLPPIDLLNNAAYPLNDRFIKLTQDKESSLAKYLIENKEAIDRLTVISNHSAVSEYFGKLVNKIERQMGENRHKSFSNYAKEAKIDDITTEQGQFSRKKVYYIKENYERFLSLRKELKTTPETKEKFKKLLKELDALHIVDGIENIGESGSKEYGFIKFINLRKEFEDAMNENPTNEEKIKQTFENLKEEERKINKMYELIKEHLGDAYETMPSNVDSYRSQLVPPCFKTNLPLNAKFNSLFIMLAFIKEKNIDIDEFVEKPIEITSKEMESNFQSHSLDNLLKDKSKGEALIYLSNTKNLPSREDPYKFTRCFDLITMNEQKEEYLAHNNIVSVVQYTISGDINRASSIGFEYFMLKPIETLQNIFMAKKDEEGKIPYLDCYVAPYSIQDNLKTNVAYDEKPTIVEQISKDENIVETFYESVNALRHFVTKRKPSKDNSTVTLHRQEVFNALQQLSAKIILTLDLKGNSKDQERGYSKQFVDDVYNVIKNYKDVELLKDLKLPVDKNQLKTYEEVINNKDSLVNSYKNRMNNYRDKKEETFILEFERINKEIDVLDNQAEKIAKKIKKGTTNKQIEDIAALQHEKFIELQKLQNSRLTQLKDDLKNGRISKYYFDVRTEQVKLLSNIKDVPAMFMHEDKNYINYKTYAKEVLKINVKDLTKAELTASKNQYNLLIRNSKEEKRLYLLNNVLKDKGLSFNKSFNYDKVELISINENVEEMKELSDELIASDLKIKEDIERKKEEINRNAIIVDLNENKQVMDNEIIIESKNIVKEKNMN